MSSRVDELVPGALPDGAKYRCSTDADCPADFGLPACKLDATSGTGTCASSAAAMVLRNTARELSAIAQGGTQQVAWPTNDSEMFLTGPAEIICTGEVGFD